MKMQHITTMSELILLRDSKIISNGTFSSGKFALEQGKPVFLAIPEVQND